MMMQFARGTTKLPPTTLPPFDLAAAEKKNFFFRQEFHRHHFHRPPSASVVGILAALLTEQCSVSLHLAARVPGTRHSNVYFVNC